MKFSAFSVIRYVLLVNMSIIIFSCSSTKHVSNNHQKDINLNNFEKYMPLQDNKSIINKTMQSEIQNLQTINIIYFPLDQYHVLSNYFSILNMHADFLRNNPLYHIKIEGHTDERGTPEYNIGLGERRAYSVKSYLQSKGVSLNQMNTISYGKEKPVSLGHTEESYSKNRRVVLSY